MLLLRTIAGSRLYGLERKDSDYDWYEVHGWIKARTIHKPKYQPGIDLRQVSFETFMLQAGAGQPQALEAMFSNMAEVDRIDHIRQHFRPNVSSAMRTYERLILDMYPYGDLKHDRYAWRLWYNICDLLDYGAFDPRLAPDEIEHMDSQIEKGVFPWDTPAWARRGFKNVNIGGRLTPAR